MRHELQAQCKKPCRFVLHAVSLFVSQDSSRVTQKMHAVLVSMTLFLMPQNQQSHRLLAVRNWRVSLHV